jgi:hypothetical protein
MPPPPVEAARGPTARGEAPGAGERARRAEPGVGGGGAGPADDRVQLGPALERACELVDELFRPVA